MAKHNRQQAAKAARNDAYATRFPRRSRSDRKKSRAERTAERDQAWCVAYGVDPTPSGALKKALRDNRGHRS